MEDAAAEFFRRASNLVDGGDHGLHQLIPVERAGIGKVSFGQRPDAFVGVELGSVGGEVLDTQAGVPTEQPCQRFAVMGGGVVQQHDDRTAEVAEQFAKKPTHFFLADIVEEKQVVETQVLASGADREAGDDGDFVAASLAITHQRCRALGRPSSDDQGS